MNKLNPISATIFIVLVFQVRTYSQTSNNNSNLKPPIVNTVAIKTGNDTFLISTRPVTNREYIIYLMWLSNRYWYDYLNPVIYRFPSIDLSAIDWYDTTQNPIERCLKYCKP